MDGKNSGGQLVPDVAIFRPTNESDTACRRGPTCNRLRCELSRVSVSERRRLRETGRAEIGLGEQPDERVAETVSTLSSQERRQSANLLDCKLFSAYRVLSAASDVSPLELRLRLERDAGLIPSSGM